MNSVKLIEAITTQFAAAIDRDALLKAKALSEERLTTVIDAMPALMSVVGRDGTYEYVNAAYERWFKVPANQVVGRSLASVLGATAYEAVSENLKRALRGERVHFETDIYLRHRRAALHQCRIYPAAGQHWKSGWVLCARP